jgi:predicted RNA-binding Zn-ribbon protein involved in translation (DUF1610 family)
MSNWSTVYVVLECTKEKVKESKIKFVDIEENLYGEDVLTFECPKCGETHKSRRYG